MAYDREKYEKQDKNTSDVRKTWRYVFMQIFVFTIMCTRKSFVCFCSRTFYTLTGPFANAKLKASIRVTVLLWTISSNSCSGVGDSA